MSFTFTSIYALIYKFELHGFLFFSLGFSLLSIDIDIDIDIILVLKLSDLTNGSSFK